MGCAGYCALLSLSICTWRECVFVRAHGRGSFTELCSRSDVCVCVVSLSLYSDANVHNVTVPPSGSVVNVV